MKSSTQLKADVIRGYDIFPLLPVRVVQNCRSHSSISLKQSFPLLVVFLFLFSIQAFSQSSSPAVIGVSGGQLSSDHVTITWTLGAVAIGRHYTADKTGSLTEGVHQPYLVVEQISDAAAFNASIFPNPVTSECIVRLPLSLQQGVSGRLVDNQGRILREKHDLTGGDTRFDLRALPAGTYYLHLRSSEGDRRAGVYKIVKVND